ncbi:MAG: hypothetical protein E7393_01205 [Ruminococcaceae bacterium]|nr:hypothetical protein [Oscillospiraceae bacterium]
MKKRLQGLIAGALIGTTITGGAAIAANTTTLYDVVANGIKIVVDGKKLNPTDANGNRVEPMIYNGTTYLPVRAVADALGKAVYWDGPEYTVYLGDMDGKLEFPTKYITDLKNISGDDYHILSGDALVDNYGNRYSDGIQIQYSGSEIEYLLNMKYSRFKATLYMREGTVSGTKYIKIIADGKTIYTSPELDKTSRPVNIDIDITGCNDFKIQFFTSYSSGTTTLGNAGFYQ